MFLDVGLPTRLRFDPNDGPFPYPDDGYPAVMIDQRHAFGCATVAEVESYWLDMLDRNGLIPEWDTRSVVPYINRGIWRANCPDCLRADGTACDLVAWDDNPCVCCDQCGRLFKVAWQPPKLRAEAVRLLAVRDRVNQNWNSHLGETVQTLEFENRWYLGEVSVQKNGVRMPASLALPGSFTAKADVMDRMA